MGTWTKGFMAGVNDYIKIKVPVNKDLKNLQGFVQSVDTAEKLDAEIAKFYPQWKKLDEEMKKKITQFQKLETEIASKVKDYRKQLDVYLKAGRERREKEYETGWKAMNVGLNQIDVLTRLKDKTYMK